MPKISGLPAAILSDITYDDLIPFVDEAGPTTKYMTTALLRTALLVGGASYTVDKVGNGVGTGGTVAQITTKATGVTLSKLSGQITTMSAALASLAYAVFTVTNTLVAAVDTIVVNVASGGTANAYKASVVAVGAGSFAIAIQNITAGSLTEAPVINFNVIKGSAT